MRRRLAVALVAGAIIVGGGGPVLARPAPARHHECDDWNGDCDGQSGGYRGDQGGGGNGNRGRKGDRQDSGRDSCHSFCGNTVIVPGLTPSTTTTTR